MYAYVKKNLVTVDNVVNYYTQQHIIFTVKDSNCACQKGNNSS